MHLLGRATMAAMGPRRCTRCACCEGEHYAVYEDLPGGVGWEPGCIAVGLLDLADRFDAEAQVTGQDGRVQYATEVVERVTAARVTPVDDPGDAAVVCVDVPGVEVAVQQATGFWAAEHLGIVFDGRDCAGEQSGLDETGLGDRLEARQTIGNNILPCGALAVQASRVGGQRAVSVEADVVNLPEDFSGGSELARFVAQRFAADVPDKDARDACLSAVGVCCYDDRHCDATIGKELEDSHFRLDGNSASDLEERDHTIGALDLEDLMLGGCGNLRGAADWQTEQSSSQIRCQAVSQRVSNGATFHWVRGKTIICSEGFRGPRGSYSTKVQQRRSFRLTSNDQY